MTDNFHPDHNLNCLLISPKFASQSFWNYTAACETMMAKTPSPPLGLLTLAAIFPQNWHFQLMDLNAQEFSESSWAWADIICVSGMLPQQGGILEIIARAKKDGKFVAVGGSDPTSQSKIYKHADALIVGEGESVVPKWLESWRNGNPKGVFYEEEKPQVTISPLPRFDLLNFSNYVQIGVQYSRGCPYNCEFCDIIELFGRIPRVKNAEQFLRELDLLHKLGYSGSIDIVDDNFIANKKKVKEELLPALIKWNEKNGYPFYYCTEAPLNLADDLELLSLMRAAEFRVLFIGIETPDPEVLKITQKAHNALKPISDRIHVLYDYGFVVTAGFIMGFDGEKPGLDRAMIELINKCSINMAMLGLLVALPNTQLTRRLLEEGRLLSFQGKLIESQEEMFDGALAQNAVLDVVDQTVAGLNFITLRDKIEILDEFRNVVEAIYEPKTYFENVRKVIAKLKMKSKHRPNLFELKRGLHGLISLSWKMTKNPVTRWHYWKTFFTSLIRGHVIFENAMRLMGIYLHFETQAKNMIEAVEKYKIRHKDMPSVPLKE